MNAMNKEDGKSEELRKSLRLQLQPSPRSTSSPESSTSETTILPQSPPSGFSPKYTKSDGDLPYVNPSPTRAVRSASPYLRHVLALESQRRSASPRPDQRTKELEPLVDAENSSSNNSSDSFGPYNRKDVADKKLSPRMAMLISMYNKSPKSSARAAQEFEMVERKKLAEEEKELPFVRKKVPHDGRTPKA